MYSRLRLGIVVCLLAAARLQADVIVTWNADDNSAAIQAALDSGAPRVILPLLEGEQNVWRLRRPLQLRSNQEVILSRGIVVQAEGSYFQDEGTPLINVEDGSTAAGYQRAKNILLRAGDGSGALPVVRFFKNQLSEPAEKHCLVLMGAQNVTVRNIEFLEAAGDGLCVAAYQAINPHSRTPSDDIVIEDCVFSRCMRNGLWIGAGRNCTIRRCTFTDTAVDGGWLPAAGLLVEPTFLDDIVENVRIVSCTTTGNMGPGYHCFLNNLNQASSDISVTFDRCTASNNGGGGIVCWARPSTFYGPAGFIEYRDCVVQDTPDFPRVTGLGIEASLECYDYRLQFRFIRCRLTDTALDGGHPIRLELPPTDKLSTSGGMRFEDCLVEDCENRCFLLVHELQFVMADWYDLGTIGDVGVTVANPVYWEPELPRQHQLISDSTFRHNCPGACCLDGGVCDYMLESECLALGGEPYGGWGCDIVDCYPSAGGEAMPGPSEAGK